eukprot:4572030-Pyramimonas_sp.AAC.1
MYPAPSEHYPVRLDGEGPSPVGPPIGPPTGPLAGPLTRIGPWIGDPGAADGRGVPEPPLL